MTKEARKHRTCISYAFMHDCLNNPVRIQFTDGSVTKYIYSAAGEKLRVTHLTAVPNISVAIGSTRELLPSEILSADSVDYLLGGSLTLRNGRIDKLLFDEGYCQATAYSGNSSQDNFAFLYYDRDHLGSIRQVIKATGSNKGVLLQTMNYYPFGAQLCDGTTDSNVQSRRYNGKELDRMHGLNTYDYGARQYNPVTARWDRVDPLSEKYYSISPYGYCANNPVKYVDPDGRKVRYKRNSSNEFKQKFANAIRILNKHGVGYIFSKLESLKTTIYIAQMPTEELLKGTAPFFDPKSNTIYWDTNMAVKTKNGTILSPYTILNHEGDHALDNVVNPEGHKKDKETEDKDYGNKMEKKTIEGTEQITAKALGEIKEGEVTRTDHKGEVLYGDFEEKE